VGSPLFYIGRTLTNVITNTEGCVRKKKENNDVMGASAFFFKIGMKHPKNRRANEELLGHTPAPVQQVDALSMFHLAPGKR